MPKLDLTADEADTLGGVLDGVISEMSTEIAATENPMFRMELNRRRDVLREVQRKLYSKA